MKTDNFEILIPAYNESATIAEVVRDIRAVLGSQVRVTVIDDGSEDETAIKAQQAGALVIRHPYHIGNGASVKTGLRHARCDVVVLMDGDGQHAALDIPILLEQIGRYDMAVGARDFSRISFRNFANVFYNCFASYVASFKIVDLTSGFRAVKRKTVMPFLYLLPNGFSYPTTLTLAFLKNARPLAYVKIGASARSKGKSKIRPVTDGVRFVLIILKIATFFSPLRVFLPMSIFFFSSALIYYGYTYLAYRRFTNMSALLFTTSLLMFALGLISEQVSQLRMDRTEDEYSGL